MINQGQTWFPLKILTNMFKIVMVLLRNHLPKVTTTHPVKYKLTVCTLMWLLNHRLFMKLGWILCVLLLTLSSLQWSWWTVTKIPIQMKLNNILHLLRNVFLQSFLFYFNQKRNISLFYSEELILGSQLWWKKSKSLKNTQTKILNTCLKYSWNNWCKNYKCFWKIKFQLNKSFKS